jgi:hypothetical protein
MNGSFSAEALTFWFFCVKAKEQVKKQQAADKNTK